MRKEIGNLGEDRGDDLILRHDREFARHIRHPGGLERGVEGVDAAWIQHRPIFSTCWWTRSASADRQCRFALATKRSMNASSAA